MKHLRGLISTAQALRRIFIVPLDFVRLQLPEHHYSVHNCIQQQRFLQTSRARTAAAASRSLTSSGTQQKQLRDEDIGSEYVQLVNETGGLDQPRRLRDVLCSLDRSQDFLMQVSAGAPRQPPICKIFNKLEMQERERERERAKSKAAQTAQTAKSAIKQIEINWSIDTHDLSHRLKKLADFLGKGRRVEVILTRKKGKRSPTSDEVKHLMDSLMEATKQANAALVKPIEGEPGKHVVVVVKGKDSLAQASPS